MQDYLLLKEMLLNKKLQYIGRTCELVWFGFGNLVERTDSKGRVNLVASYALHLQCPFRVADDNGILVGYNDLFVSSEDICAAVDLDERDCTMFDKKVDNLKQLIENEYVKDVSVNKYGDLSVQLSNLTLNVFVANSIGEEAWRFFKLSDEYHIVVEGR